ncbi:MAG: hypothetical protein HDS65_06105 [Bacteroidales bacterium]|nr:hypothetical protein [Bacteroidales bacterium]
MSRTAAVSVLSAIIALTASCGGGRSSDMPTPRRHAFPRVEQLDTTRRHIAAAELEIGLSASAEAESPREDWVTAHYPSLGANLHLSVSRFSDEKALAEAIANRRQRMALNAGGGNPRTDNFSTPEGWMCERVTAPERVATPVQFIAAGPGFTLVSGAFALGGSLTPADSLRPIVEELDNEAFKILTTLPAEGGKR